MPEQIQFLENSLQEISRLARQTLNLLALSDPRPTPEKYLAAVLNARALNEMWAQHIRSENALFPAMVSRDPHFAAYLDRIADENHEIAGHLASLATAP